MMFDIIPKLLSSVASFLFPLFASYKALKTSDPTQLTPWLMYWSVLSCALLAESWVEFVLVWIPFYSYMRLVFLLYLVLPQTQGARVLYETYLYPYLSENESAIEEFIANAHDRLRTAGITYLKRAIELLRTQVFGLAPNQELRAEEPKAAAAPQGYTQALLARFSVPVARWAAGSAGPAGQDFFSMLANAVGGAGGAAPSSSSSSSPLDIWGAATSTSTLIPEHIGGAEAKMSFIAKQREQLALMMGALDKEAQQLQRREAAGPEAAGASLSRPPSGHSVWSGLSKSRSEVDFEKIDAESGTEENDGELRRRAHAAAPDGFDEHAGGARGWGFLGWGTVGAGQTQGQAQGPDDSARSSGVQQ
ncbi:TB2/DP1, HVA22 family-domain-containing protein [Durotheca rogersii]|uniref:TB2/DP1, HVA22 family-domain-containing protein n=1 Tax=Durotheca rogersii TaxID=419775 RepID=UPI00221F3E43|nr:TB2/DP1, HVA22 family-domain-containing protein [Durotheca rogersii]KAI5861443.1 TB2/DP1, HVA22 family-domain-containing protein [Durotheca rogersii]